MMMITTKAHGYLDYAMGLLLILMPLIWESNNETAATIFIAVGIGVLLYSILTDYELGVFRVISMRTHLMIDVLGGIFLLVSPWLFGFSDELYWPFVILGALEIMAGLMTKKEPAYPQRANLKNKY